MLLKWIVCKVPDESKNAFSRAQQEWAGLKAVPGFLGQLGGWDLNAANDACLLGLWADQQAYAVFMKEHHDTMFHRSKQAATYGSIAVLQLEPVLPMPGSCRSMLECLHKASVVRVADCRVKPEHEQHFLEVQREVWIPAMAASEGMLAGSFNKSITEAGHYIVITLWSSRQLHEHYAANRVPELRRIANVSQDIETIEGRLVQLEPLWLVLADGYNA